MRVSVDSEPLTQVSLPAGCGEIVDERCGSDEESIEAILDGAVGDGRREMRLGEQLKTGQA